MMDIAADAIGEAIRADLWSIFSPAESTGLGLVICQQGQGFDLPAPADLDSRLPAVMIEFLEWSATVDRPREALRAGTYRYRVHFLCAINAGEESQRKTIQRVERLAERFCQDEFAFPGTFPSGLGLLHRKTYPTAITMYPTDELAQLEYLVGHGAVDVTVEADSFKH